MAAVVMFSFSGVQVTAQSRGDDSFEWISTDQSTWYKPKQIRLKWEKDLKEERLIVPVKGLQVSKELFPLQILCDYSFDSRLDRFVFPELSKSKFIRHIEDVGAISEVKTRFKLHLHPKVSYDLSYDVNPDRLIIHLFRLPDEETVTPHYFIQSKESYIKRDLKPLLIQLGMETDRRDIFRLRIRSIDAQIRAYPIDQDHYHIWIGPFESYDAAKAAQPKFYQYYNDQKEDEELAAFKQYLTYHLRPTQETGFDVKSLREDFLKGYREKKVKKADYEYLYKALSQESTIIAY